jgi:HD superfamily phosphohydrolase
MLNSVYTPVLVSDLDGSDTDTGSIVESTNTKVRQLDIPLKTMLVKSKTHDQSYISTYKQFDSVHGLIDLSVYTKDITNHPVFSRLRKIRQLGTLHFKFTYANDSRFEHSIGVAYLARSVGQSLQRKHPEITSKQILCMELAGLCHDLGHGAYSHSFDHLLHDLKFKHQTKNHELRSQILFRHMVEDMMQKNLSNLYLSDQDIRLVQYFIDPVRYKQHITTDKLSDEQIADCKFYPKDIGVIYHGIEQVVNNPLSKVDVDKMDYISRDAQSLRFDQTLRGMLDIKGLLKRSMIVDKTWMFNIKDQGIIYDLICRRFLFYTNSYLHPDVNSVNCMFIDAIRMADKFLEFSQCSKLESKKDIDDFCKITDDYLLELIINSTDVRLEDSRSLLIRICTKKDWYKHVGDFVTSVSNLDDSYCEMPWEILSDSSSPTNLLPKVKYHQNGECIDPKNVRYVRRLYIKSPNKTY